MVSVCMATFNGEKYVHEQISSILLQLEKDDELIISDDGSTDSTVALIRSFADDRIKLFQNSFKNVVKNFEFCLGQAVGDYIFLSDQDDIWHPEKLRHFITCFKDKDADMVVSDVAIIDRDGNILPDVFYKNKFTGAVLKNLIKNNFIGCATAFRKHTLKWFLPFPKDVAMHDWWIGLAIGTKGKIEFLPEKLLYYRRHGNNLTSGRKSSLKNIIYWRWSLIKNLL